MAVLKLEPGFFHERFLEATGATAPKQARGSQGSSGVRPGRTRVRGCVRARVRARACVRLCVQLGALPACPALFGQLKSASLLKGWSGKQKVGGVHTGRLELSLSGVEIALVSFHWTLNTCATE